MKLVPFNKSSLNHKIQLMELLTARNMAEGLVNDIPECSLLAFIGENLVAFGALRQVEGNIAMLDSFITNPSASSLDRNTALDRLAIKLIKIAEYYGVRMILSFSADPNTIERGERHGFTPMYGHKFQIRSKPYSSQYSDISFKLKLDKVIITKL